MGRSQKGREDLVEDAPRLGAEDVSVGEPVGAEGIGGLPGFEEGTPDPLGIGPACPHDPDTARAGRRGNRGDGVWLDHRGLGP
jgi:hypothetical protein